MFSDICQIYTVMYMVNNYDIDFNGVFSTFVAHIDRYSYRLNHKLPVTLTDAVIHNGSQNSKLITKNTPRV